MSIFKTSLAVALAAALALTAGCGNKVSIEEGKAKIAELSARGVPERQMSDLKMYLFQMESAKKIGNSAQLRKYQDSLTIALGDFEEKIAKILAESGPFMDSLRRACDDKLAALKGLHLEEGEKGKTAVDSLMQIESEKLYARERLETWSLVLDTIIDLQKLADSLRAEFVGIWVQEKESADPSVKVLERNEIHMRPDGKLFILEGKKSRFPDGSFEDWLFESHGAWDIMGDVAHHHITREKRVRQNFRGINPQTGKMESKNEKPYDSTFAKGTKDRFAAWESLNADYKRFPIGGRR